MPTLTLVAVLSVLATSARAHDISWTPVQLRLDPAERAWTLELTADLDALALGRPLDSDDREMRDHLAGLARGDLDAVRGDLRALLDRRVRIRFQGSATLPNAAEFPEEGRREDSWFGLRAVLTGTIPDGAGNVSVRLSRAFPPAILRVERPGSPTWHRLLEKGTPSPDLPLVEPIAARSNLSVTGDYVVLGFLHILPRGLDHVLFVLCLFLLAPRWRPLLWQVSAFTLAHTITLALATLGHVRLPPSVVEPAIAFSIAVLALENLRARELHRWRPAVVFAFGLLHGLGFAGVLGDVGLPESAITPALLGFNVGVELGQLTVLAGAFVLVGLWRDRPWFRSRITVPASLVIALTGAWWTLERIFFGG